jgi:NAD(P)-dependent dehydrogenase (short-subunit alcohol dehydrogenase family)
MTADSTNVRTAIVTGGARGIGSACARALADAGYRIVLVDIDDAAGGEASAALPGSGHEYVRLDLRDVAAIRAAVEDIHARRGRIDVLVNNAGVTRVIDLFDVEEAEWNRIAEINSRGTFFMMQAVAARMERGGSIVNIASIAGKGWKETSNIAYAGSKGAVVAMTRIAAARLGASGIRVNAVCPGITTTDLMLGWIRGRAENEGVEVAELLSEIAQQVPLGILNESEDVAAAVLFLAGEGARTITGQSLNVDGGIVFD